MSRANEIYDYERHLKKLVDRIADGIDVNKDTLLRYYTNSIAEGLSLARIWKRLTTVKALSQMLNLRFESATKDDMVRLVAEIEGKQISTRTKQDYKKILKTFYKWLKGGDESPQEVKWIKPGSYKPGDITKKDLLTTDEVDRIIENARDVQEKAFFSVLFDSGRRFGEILGLTMKDVDFDGLGAKLRVDGKVGKDIARICASAPRLATWVDNHPGRNNPNSPMWVILSKGKLRQMSYYSAWYRLKQAVKRAGITKRVWLYLFRHSRITPASTRLTYSQLCHVFGWKQGSNMPQFYVHLAGDDRDQAFLKMNDLPIPEDVSSSKTVYVPTLCKRCKRSNSPDAKYCNGCGLAFDLKYASEFDQRKEDIKQKIETLSTELTRSPEVLDTLLEALASMKKGNHS